MLSSLHLFSGYRYISQKLVLLFSETRYPDWPAFKIRVVRAICDVFFRSMPMRPSKGKWTKLGPSLDWWMEGLGVMGIVSRCWRVAYLKLSMRSTRDGPATKDPEILQDFHWHALEGARFTVINSTIHDAATLTWIIILCIVIEPLRFITQWFIRRSSPSARAKAYMGQGSYLFVCFQKTCVGS
jgi:hypothetical protein